MGDHAEESANYNVPRQKANKVHEVEELLVSTISHHLNIKTHSVKFNIADLGCSVGPHTFSVMNIVTKAVLEKYRTKTEFSVFFNDFLSNDFNALFKNLPADRNYFSFAVPGSFHQRLFPETSLDFVYTSKSLQYLTKAPEELSDPDSPAFNGDRIFYINAPDAVCDAYSAQFSRDMDSILNARAKEMIPGGLMVILIPGRASGSSRAEYYSVGQLLAPLEPILLDLKKEGKVSKEKMDSFNMAMYYPSPEEMEEIVGMNGSFEMVEMVCLERKNMEAFSAHEIRIGYGGMLADHFGSETMEEVIDRYQKDFPRISQVSKAKEGNGVVLYVVIRLKMLR